MLLDADFVPSISLCKIAKQGIRIPQQAVMIVAAFQIRGDAVDWKRVEQSGVLTGKQSVIRCFEEAGINSTACGGTGLAVGPYARYLAATMNYSAWWSAQVPYSARAVMETEPYYIANTADHLAFDERFVGYGADKAEHFFRVMQQNISQIVSPDHYIVHVHLQQQSAPNGAHGHWGEDRNAKRWQQANLLLYQDLFTSIPHKMLHNQNIRWSDVYPPCVLENPELYEWALGPVAELRCEDINATHHVCSHNCTAALASWGNCQPPIGYNAACGDDDHSCGNVDWLDGHTNQVQTTTAPDKMDRYWKQHKHLKQRIRNKGGR